MVNQHFSRLSVRGRAILIALAAIILPIELLVHGAFAREYYYLNVNDLRLVALTAVKIGAQYLPVDPAAAIRMADAYARHHGIARAEIVLTELSPDGKVLTIRLERKIPQYLAVLAMGGLPARDIDVTASAGPQGAGHPAALRSAMFGRSSSAGLVDGFALRARIETEPQVIASSGAEFSMRSR
jgi:hypothetical protein